MKKYFLFGDEAVKCYLSGNVDSITSCPYYQVYIFDPQICSDEIGWIAGMQHVLRQCCTAIKESEYWNLTY